VSASARIAEEYVPRRGQQAATTETRGGAYSLPMQTGDDFGANEMRLNHYKMQDKG